MRKKDIVLILCGTAIGCLIVLLIVHFISYSSLFSKKQNFEIQAEEVVGEMAVGTQFIQSFEMPFERFKGMDAEIGTYARENDGELIVELYQQEDEKALYNWKVNFEMLQDNSIYSFKIPDGIPVKKGEEYRVTFSVEDTNPGHSITLYSSSDDDYAFGELYIRNGDMGLDTGKDLCIQISGNDSPRWGILFVFTILISMVVSMSLLRCIRNPCINEINSTDKIILGIIIFIMTFFFSQQGDINTVLDNAKLLINCIIEGELGDYYGYALNFMIPICAPNYNILLYGIVAIIILPLFLTEILVGIVVPDILYEILFAIVLSCTFVFVGRIVNKIVIKIGIDNKKADIIEYLFLLSPILLFGSIGFKQLDIFYIAVVLYSLLFYIEGRYNLFALTMSISIAMKTFPIFIFIPLVLMFEKRIYRIVKYFAEGLSIPFLFYIIWGHQESYQSIQKTMESIYGFTYQIFANQLPTGMGSFSIFVASWFIICFWCYYRISRGSWENVMSISVLVYSFFAVFVTWHPQYLVIYATFLTLATTYVKNKNRYIGIQAFLSLSYLIICLFCNPQNTDNYMFLRGILPRIVGVPIETVTFRQIIEGLNFDYIYILFVSLFVASVFALACICLDTHEQQKNENLKKDIVIRGYVFLPLIPLLGFILLSAVLCWGI